MLLIFQLGRKDVLPADDFGVRNGFRIAYNKREMPSPRRCWRSARNGGRTARRRRGISGARRTRAKKKK